ncbi:MAG: thioredoxin family protein [Candidatus Nanohaloarchaea archaeon]
MTVKIELFYSDTCPNCPPQKDAVKEFADRDDVSVRMTNVARKKGRARNHGVRSVPTTVVDGPALDQKTGFRGVTSDEKLEEAIEVAKGEKDRSELESTGILEKLRDALN